MGSHGLEADAEYYRDLLARLAHRHVAENLGLPCRKNRLRLHIPLLDKRRGIGGYAAYRRREDTPLRALRHVASGPVGLRLVHLRLERHAGEQDDPGRRVRLPHAHEKLEPRHAARHVDVGDDYIGGALLPAERNRLLRRGDGAVYREILFAREKHLKPVAHDRMVVYYQNACHMRLKD